MFLENLMVEKFSLLPFELAQVTPETTIETAEEASFVFSGPQFFTALVAGVVLAFAFQLLFTNLGVAAGISLMGGKSSRAENSERESFGGTIRKIGFTVGLGTLISVTLSLFIASLCAVKLSLFLSPVLGAIIGLVIWAAYFTLLVWISSSTVGSLIGSVMNTATSGFQALWGTAAAMVGSQAINRQVVSTAEAAAAAVRRELGSALDAETLKENLQDYIETLRLPSLNLQGIRNDFEKILNTSEFNEVLASGDLPNLDKQAFAQLIEDRSDLSKRDAQQLAEQLEAVWKQKIGQGQPKNTLATLVDYLKSAKPEELLGRQLGDRVDALVEEMGKRNQAQKSPGGAAQALTFSLNSLMGLVLGRSDLSELDVEKVTTQLQKLKGYAGEQKDKLIAQVKQQDSYSPIRADVENYLLNAYSWQLRKVNLDREFRTLIYDPDANPEIMIAELESINRSDFANWLQQKGLYTQEQIQVTATLLDNIRLEALAAAESAHERDKVLALLAGVDNYLINTPKSELQSEKIQLHFKPILEDPETDSERLAKRLSQLDYLTFRDYLEQRHDLLPEEIDSIIRQLESVQAQVLRESQDAGEAIKAQIDQQWLKLQTYLKDTGKEELNPDAIEREIKLLLDDPQAGSSALRARVSRFDRDTLVQLLAQRRDLSEAQVNQTIERVENTWTQVRYAPQQLAGKAKDQYDRAVNSISDYLRSTGKEELNPEGIQRDLKKLLDDPSEGAKAIRSRLARMDRDTLVKLLSQREDLSEGQVNEVLDNVLLTLQDLGNAPRRLARRTQAKVQDFQESIADYLRSTDKEEFNPEGIKRDVHLLLNDPRAGVENLQDRLSKIDRESLIALLSQREDISQEDAKRIIDQILVVRERALEQLQSLQRQLQSAIDRLLATIREYLNSLERPELNYDGIKTDIRTLFDDPQAGFDSLRDRFSQVDRDTLVAVLSSREDISQADAERLISQVERTRDRMLQRAERLQQEAQYRLERVKEDAQKQVEETRKAAATASWWLFFTALFSAIASASAGALGVII